MPKNILFKNFWKTKDLTRIFLENLFSEIDTNGKKILISSVFIRKSIFIRLLYFLMNKYETLGNRNAFNLAKYNLASPVDSDKVINIWYTGENIRPPYDKKWDLILSFENETKINNNVFLPFWATTFGETTESAKLKQNYFILPRNQKFEKRKFACAVISNPEPIRMRIIEELSKIGQVDLYGSVFNKAVTDKTKVVSDYYFNICFENDLYPNYITEKIFQSWDAGAVPIWWGLDKSGYINEKALINFASGSIESNLEQLRFLLANPREILKLANLPLLKKEYDYSFLISEINSILNKN